jgi:hypothetical protein
MTSRLFTRLAGKEYAEFEISRNEWEGVRVTTLTNNFTDLDRFELLYTHPIIDARFEAFLADVRPDLVHVHAERLGGCQRGAPRAIGCDALGVHCAAAP